MKGTVRAVFGDKANAFGLERARQAGIATHTLIASAFDSREAYEQKMINKMDILRTRCGRAGWFVYCALSPGVCLPLSMPDMLNISLLCCKYPGLHTHRQALENGDEEHGTSVHFVTDELDDGPVILQAKVPGICW
ncbi:phosphoribosylglycinamide formyltransferase [Escherichia coli]